MQRDKERIQRQTESELIRIIMEEESDILHEDRYVIQEKKGLLFSRIRLTTALAIVFGPYLFVLILTGLFAP